MPYTLNVFTFIETKLFTRLVKDYLTDEEYRELQTALIESPEAGDVIPGSGGVHKIRWRAKGRGKRGGYRIIYFMRFAEEEIWLVTMYPKNVTDTISADVLKKIREEIENG